jgi:pyridoxal 5'-phosphate synthase pdxS subunit
MDVINVEQALIAEAAGACAVMALERVPADIRKNGMVACLVVSRFALVLAIDS